MRLGIPLGLAFALAAAPAFADQASAVQAVRGLPKVIDAMADNQGNLYVSVKAEKQPWDQFATAVCNAVKPHKARIFTVRVVDVLTVAVSKKPASWKVLAESRCAASLQR